MYRRFLSFTLIMGFFVVFLLFGTLRLQWSAASRYSTHIGLSLAFNFPNQHPQQTQTIPESLVTSFRQSFGETRMERVGSYPYPTQLKPKTVITPQSIWKRFQQMFQIHGTTEQINASSD